MDASSASGHDPRRAARRTAWLLGALALAFFVGAFVVLPR